MKLFKYILKTIALLAIVFSCSNNSESSEEAERIELDNLKTEIEQLITTGVCTENTDCDFIAFGSKACGGPMSYLVYSTSINVELLKEKVSIYNTNEAAFNIKWNVISDCMFLLPPTSVDCVNGECVIIN